MKQVSREFAVVVLAGMLLVNVGCASKDEKIDDRAPEETPENPVPAEKAETPRSQTDSSVFEIVDLRFSNKLHNGRVELFTIPEAPCQVIVAIDNDAAVTVIKETPECLKKFGKTEAVSEALSP